MRKRKVGHGADARAERAPLSRERVLRAAVRLADGSGLEALSMRLLGREMGVEAMSLYNHVSGKDDLLDGMVDMVLAEVDQPSEGASWRESMRARALSARKAFAAHPWAAALIDSRIRSGPVRMRYLEAVLSVLRRAGFPVELAGRAFGLIDGWIYGFLIQSRNAASNGKAGRDAAREFLANLAGGGYPCLAEMAAWSAERPESGEEDFEFGLDLILDGLQRALDAASR